VRLKVGHDGQQAAIVQLQQASVWWRRVAVVWCCALASTLHDCFHGCL
jgi:hypothetical protein